MGFLPGNVLTRTLIVIFFIIIILAVTLVSYLSQNDKNKLQILYSTPKNMRFDEAISKELEFLVKKYKTIISKAKNAIGNGEFVHYAGVHKASIISPTSDEKKQFFCVFAVTNKRVFCCGETIAKQISLENIRLVDTDVSTFKSCVKVSDSSGMFIVNTRKTIADALAHLIIKTQQNKLTDTEKESLEQNPNAILENSEEVKPFSASEMNINTYANKKLTACRTCGKEIAKTAKRCPHCGAITSAEITGQVAQGIAIILIFVVIIAGAVLFWSQFSSINSMSSSVSTAVDDTSNNAETVFFEDNYIRASFIKVYEEDIISGAFYLQLRVENKSSQNITVALSNASVNKMSTTIGSGLPMEIAPGNSSKQPFIIFSQNLDISSVSEIEDISFSFYLLNDNVQKIEETNIITLKF